MKYKRVDLFQIWGILNNLKEEKLDIKIRYTIAKNKNILKDEIETYHELLKPKGEIKEFEDSRVKLCEKYSLKEGTQQIPKIANNQYVIEDLEGFNLEIEELKLKFPNLDQEREKQNKEINDFIGEEVELDRDLKPFYLEQIPNDLFTVPQLQTLDILKMICE